MSDTCSGVKKRLEHKYKVAEKGNTRVNYLKLTQVAYSTSVNALRMLISYRATISQFPIVKDILVCICLTNMNIKYYF